MAKFKYESKEEKARLQERAQSLKPKTNNVVATDRGWAQSRPNGTMELLVSFAGLDELLGDVDVEVVDPTPVEVNVLISVEADLESELPEVVIPEVVHPVIEEDEEDPVVVIHKKQGGRPKKAA